MNQNAQQPTIEVHCGDLALALMRYKTMHYLPIPPQLKVGDVVWLQQLYNPSLRIPVVITAQSQASDRALTMEEREACGRYIPRRHQNMFGIYPGNFVIQNTGTSKMQQIQFRRCTPQDITQGTQEEKIGLHDRWQKAYQLVAEVLTPQVKLAHNYLCVLSDEERNHKFKALQHASENGDKHNHLQTPDDAMLDAVEFLHNQHHPLRVSILQRRLWETSEMFSQSRALDAKPKTRIAGPRHIDGVDHYKALAAYPNTTTTLGTGALIHAGFAKKIISFAPFSTKLATGDRLLVRLHARHALETHDGKADCSFDLPVIVPLDQTPVQLHASDITDAIAQEHGYASAKVMRHGLTIKKDTNLELFSYPIEPATKEDLPFDENKAKKAAVNLHNRVVKAWEGSKDHKGYKDHSVATAHEWLDSMDAASKQAIEEALTPIRAMSSPLKKKKDPRFAQPSENQHPSEPSTEAKQNTSQPPLKPQRSPHRKLYTKKTTPEADPSFTDTPHTKLDPHTRAVLKHVKGFERGLLLNGEDLVGELVIPPKREKKRSLIDDGSDVWVLPEDPEKLQEFVRDYRLHNPNPPQGRKIHRGNDDQNDREQPKKRLSFSERLRLQKQLRAIAEESKVLGK